MRELQPINQHVLLEIDEKKEQKTVGGIILPTKDEKKSIGKVLAISKIDNPEISVGDLVIYKEYSGTKIEMDEKKYLLIQYSDIIAKIVETEKI